MDNVHEKRRFLSCAIKRNSVLRTITKMPDATIDRVAWHENGVRISAKSRGLVGSAKFPERLAPSLRGVPTFRHSFFARWRAPRPSAFLFSRYSPPPGPPRCGTRISTPLRRPLLPSPAPPPWRRHVARAASPRSSLLRGRRPRISRCAIVGKRPQSARRVPRLPRRLLVTAVASCDIPLLL